MTRTDAPLDRLDDRAVPLETADPEDDRELDGDHYLHSIGAVYYSDPEKNRSR